jgi:hypothetical protein
MPSIVDGRCAYERAQLDLFLFYNSTLESWCIGDCLPEQADLEHRSAGKLVVDTSVLAAMVSDQADSPELIKATWEVYDHDLDEFACDPDSNLKVNKFCVAPISRITSNATFVFSQY